MTDRAVSFIAILTISALSFVAGLWFGGPPREQRCREVCEATMGNAEAFTDCWDACGRAEEG